MSEESYARQREQMILEQLKGRGIRDEAVLEAMAKVPRHVFVPEEQRSQSYADNPVTLGPQQTISQPFMVATMLCELKITGQGKALDIGTGSGYLAALLAELCGSVYSVELDADLAGKAESLLQQLGYRNIRVKCGDGRSGWEEHAPYDYILVSAAAAEIPRALVRQLAVGGKLILPVGENEQYLTMLRKDETGIVSTDLGKVAFVPLQGCSS